MRVRLDGRSERRYAGGQHDRILGNVLRAIGRLPEGETAVLPNVNHDGPVRDPAGLAAMIEGFVAKH